MSTGAGMLPPPSAPAAGRRPFGPLARVGLRAKAGIARAQASLTFIGELLQVIARRLRPGSGRGTMRWQDLWLQIDQTGPRSVGIVSLVSGLVGVILAYMGATQLQRFGAQAYIADLVTIGAVREIAALMTGVILSGRVGAAFTAQLASMQANEEIDALRALGIDPMEHLVLPRMLAMALVAPLLTAYAAVVAVLAGWLVAVVIFGVAPMEYLFKCLQVITLPHVLVGLFKGEMYAVLVALSGCLHGLSAGRSAEAVGLAVTNAVVKAIVWIVIAASASTVALQRLNW
jgi:phospholipid/cholesterol/gamma-HCH transport system permease protein